MDGSCAGVGPFARGVAPPLLVALVDREEEERTDFEEDQQEQPRRIRLKMRPRRPGYGMDRSRSESTCVLRSARHRTYRAPVHRTRGSRMK